MFSYKDSEMDSPEAMLLHIMLLTKAMQLRIEIEHKISNFIIYLVINFCLITVYLFKKNLAILIAQYTKNNKNNNRNMCPCIIET